MARRYYWLKLRDTFFEEPKIKKLRRIAGGDTFTIIYLKMLLLSINNGGMLIHEGIEEDFSDELSLVMNEDAENVKLTLAFLQTHNLIESHPDRNYFLPKSAEMVGSESESAGRMRKSRGNKTSQCDAIPSQCAQNVTLEKREKTKEKREKKKESALYRRRNSGFDPVSRRADADRADGSQNHPWRCLCGKI